jgi:cyclic pyranopterin phosphate synthase
MMTDETTLNSTDKVRMADVGDKPDTEREATAKALVRMQPATLTTIQKGELTKGDVLATAQIAGIMAAKNTPLIVPLCHPLLISNVAMDFRLDESESEVEITATVKTTGKTGVEMEALTAVTASALTIYDMCKSIDPGIRIEGIRLTRKSGGKSGTVELE